MTNKNKKKNKKKRNREMRKFVETGGQKCIEFFRHLASSQQWREHGTLPPLSNDEALILNHMYQVWLSQSPAEKESFLRQGEQRRHQRGVDRAGSRSDVSEAGGQGQHHDAPLQQSPALLPSLPSLSLAGMGADSEHGLEKRSKPEDALASASQTKTQTQTPFAGLDPGNSSQSVSVSLCISTIKNSLAQHHQYSDSLQHLVGQLDVLVKAPEPTRTHANDLLVMMLSPDFIHRDTAALEQRVDLVSSLHQDDLAAHSSAEQRREREVHLAVASACCILLALLAESEHRITDRYKASLPPPFQHIIAQQLQAETLSGDTAGEVSPDVKRLYDDIASSYYLRSLTIAHTRPLDAGEGGEESVREQQGATTASTSCGGRNSIAAMQLGSKYLRGGVEKGALLSVSSSKQGVEGITDESDNKAVVQCEQEYRQAFQWFLQAALLENPIAQHKVGYFYDEGLPLGACEVHIMEAVKWYSRAAELMPDSMHNLAKIYEDGRGGFEADLKQAVTLYSVAAARGFPLSQVNLGRLFLLGEDGVQRDREAGKRLLTLAAESGDADAQMVVGMIHATPAFECFDLALSEHWLRCSMAGGKQDAERLLVRVRQQMQQQNKQLDDNGGEDTAAGEKKHFNSNEGALALERQQISSTGLCAEDKEVPGAHSGSQVQLALAAKQRGDDFLAHGLLHAAVLEFSRAFELDRSSLGYFVDRLDTLFLLGHYEECLSDSSLLLDCVDVNGEKLGGSQPRPEESAATDNAMAMKRLFAVLSRCLSCMFSGWDRDKAGRSRRDMKEAGLPENFISALPGFHRDAIVRTLLVDCMELSGDSLRATGQTQGLSAARASAFLARLSLVDVKGNCSIVRNGGVPMLLAVLNTVCKSIWQSSAPSVSALSDSAGAEVDRGESSSNITTAIGAYPSSTASPGQKQYAFVREQLWLNCLVTFQHLLNPPMTAFTPSASGGGAGDDLDLEEQEDSHILSMKKKKLLKRRNLIHLISAADGFSTLANCTIACLQAIIQTASFRRADGSNDSEHLSESHCDDDVRDSLEEDVNKVDVEGGGAAASRLKGKDAPAQHLHYYYFRDCIALTRTTTTIMQIIHCTSTVADSEHLWPELLRGGLVRACSSAIASSVLTAQLQLEVLRQSAEFDLDREHQDEKGQSGRNEHGLEDEEAAPPLPVLLHEESLELPAAYSEASQKPQLGRERHRVNRDSNSALPFHLHVGHVCIALRHLAHSIQATEQLLKVAPLEVLLSLSASDTMGGLHQILSMLALRSSSSVSVDVEAEGVRGRASAGSLQGLVTAVHQNLAVSKEPAPSVSATSSALLALTTPASKVLDRMDASSSAEMLSALMLPICLQYDTVASDSVDDNVSRLSSRLSGMSPVYREALDTVGGNSGRGESDDSSGNILQSLQALVETAAELKADAASCLCALLCARDPRNGDLLRENFAPDRLDHFLWLVKQQETR